jgi:hypothetical protein
MKHMKYLLTLVTGLFVVITANAAIYQYTNKQGKTAYSDVPVKNSKEVIVPPVMTYTPAPIVVTPVVKEVKTEPKVQGEAYKSLVILSPEEQGTVRDNQGNVAVTVDLEPKLQKGDKIELFIDGIKQPALVGLGIERGEHKANLQVVDKEGRVLIQSPEITFFLQHNSKLMNKK